MKRRALAVLVMAAAGAACFSMHEPSDTGPAISCARAQGAPGPDTAFVIIRGFAFAPADLSVSEGTTVIWVNCEDPGTPGHTTTSDGWDSPTLQPGDHFAVKPAVGTHAYHCRPHPFMQGTVTVAAAQAVANSRRYLAGVRP